MRPFLFLGVREQDDAADDEYAAMLTATGLHPDDLHRVRVEAAPLGELDLTAYSGLLLGGGPFCVSDPEETKSALQRRVERDLDALLDRVVAADTPFMGCCYGIGTLGRYIGATVDTTYGEPVGAVRVELTQAGLLDPVLGAAGGAFTAFVGHKEAVHRLPASAVPLARSDATPVQAFRVGQHVYATQFHPELDFAGLQLRVRAVAHHGYFLPDELDQVLARAAAAGVDTVPPVLRRFVEVHAH
ncbi:glutamine amidotransferase [Cellulomonas citrea]|uniref:glutamine amidotransferase n=1 Tax=Cellulomonas citrea TaxID=1909423 RepID=UPI00135732FD|nr:glutamine amidotransferase [Cellulomonas citrea]